LNITHFDSNNVSEGSMTCTFMSLIQCMCLPKVESIIAMMWC